VNGNLSRPGEVFSTYDKEKLGVVVEITLKGNSNIL
jgi:hypothetical protein